MERGLDPPCLELGDGPEHRLLYWAGSHTGRQGLVTMSENKLEFQVRRVPGAGMETFQHLEDAGYVERVQIGESYRYRVLVFCTCSGGLSPISYPAQRWESRLRLDDPPVVGYLSESGSVGGASNGVKSESVQKSTTTIYLAKYFFPEVVRGAGIQMTPLQTNSAALGHHLNRWKLQGVDLSTMKLMMREFARHPEWCQHSGKPPWQVFVGRRGELASIVATTRRWKIRDKDWVAATPRVTKDWLGHRTPRVNYAI